MKIHLLSDLHFEFGPLTDYTPPECDVVLLAGDIAVDKGGIDWAKETFGDTPVLYTPGNHEFYDRKWYRPWIEELKEHAAGSNVTVMANDTVIIDGVRFLGATLWTDFDLYGNKFYARLDAERQMNDYRRIRHNDGSRLSSGHTQAYHWATVQYFTEQFKRDPDIKTVIMTHHAPSEMSSVPQYRGHYLTPAYASRLEPFMLEHNPVLWVHGHMHNSNDYVIGDTRVVSNPRGYAGHELNPTFDPFLVIEI